MLIFSFRIAKCNEVSSLLTFVSYDLDILKSSFSSPSEVISSLFLILTSISSFSNNNLIISMFSFSTARCNGVFFSRKEKSFSFHASSVAMI